MLLLEPANRIVATSFSLVRDPRSLGWAPVARRDRVLRQNGWKRVKKRQKLAKLTVIYTHETCYSINEHRNFVSFVIHLVTHYESFH